MKLTDEEKQILEQSASAAAKILIYTMDCLGLEKYIETGFVNIPDGRKFKLKFERLEILNGEIRERCEFNCLEKKDGPECYMVLGRCIVCPHYTQLNAERT